MPRGRKPIPTAIKILKGTARKDRIAGTISAPAAIPDCPECLEGTAREEWHRLARQMFELGTLTLLDRSVLMGYCLAYARLIEAQKKVAELGQVIKSPNGYPVKNPYLSNVHEEMRQMRAYAAELGLTPSSRSRVNVKPHKKENTGVMKRSRA